MDRALALPAEDRARLVRQLLLSLEPWPVDDPAEVERLWSEEIDTRIERADSGRSTETDWRVAVERVRKSLDQSNA